MRTDGHNQWIKNNGKKKEKKNASNHKSRNNYIQQMMGKKFNEE